MTRKSEPVHVLAPSIWKELIGEDPWKEDGFAVPYQTVSETSVMPGIYLDEIHLKEKAITEKKQQLVKENSKEKVLVLRHVPTGLGSMEFDSLFISFVVRWAHSCINGAIDLAPD